MARDPRPVPFLVVNTLAFLAVSVLASAALWPIYSSPSIVLLVGVTLCVGTGVAILGAVYRWPSVVVLLATVAAFLIFGVPLAVPDRALYGVLPTLGGLTELVRGAGLGWKQLLTISLPVGSYQQLLVPAFVLVLFSTVIGLSVSLRARYGELGVFAPAVLFVAAIALGPDTAPFPAELALGFLVVTLLWLVWNRWYRRGESIRLLNAQNGSPIETPSERRFLGARTLLGAVATLAVATVLSAGATALVPPQGGRDVLRSVVRQPFDPQAHASPLAGFRKYLQQGRESMVMLTVSGLPPGAGVRLATLDTYDGVVYSVGGESASSASGSFTRVPFELDQSEVDGSRATVGVTVEAYSGIWLPTVGQLETIDFAGENASALEDSFYFNDTTDTGVVTRGLGPGDSYRFSTVVPTVPTTRELASARPGSAVVPGIELLPDELATSLQSFVAGASTPGERLVAMIDGLRESGYVSHGVSPDEPLSRSGHGADRITELLTDNPMVGDAEQYAVTAALMANRLGFPARVVFGFRPSEDARRPAGADIPLTGADVTAWIEVNTQDGWLSVDPNPEVREIPEERPDEPTVVSRPQSVLPPPDEERIEPDEQLPPDTSEEEQPAVDPLLAFVFAALRVAGGVVLGLALVTSPFLAVIAAKLRRRRRRRRSGTPLDRIRGGWQEFADTAVDHGYEPPRSATRTEIAEVVGGSGPLVLAKAADRAAFGPAVADDRQAEQVWRVVTELRSSLSRGRGRWERIKALVSVRSFGGHAFRSLFRR